MLEELVSNSGLAFFGLFLGTVQNCFIDKMRFCAKEILIYLSVLKHYRF